MTDGLRHWQDDEQALRSLLSNNIRLYAQMRPDETSLQHLSDIQRALPSQPRGYAVPAKRMHVTLIHFGKIHEIYALLQRSTGIKHDDYIRLLTGYIKNTNSLLPVGTHRLEPLRWAAFGEHGNTLVIEYMPETELQSVHAKLSEVLQQFLRDCGVQDVEGFMAKDPNFKQALTFRPHLTLYKGYFSALPDLSLSPISLETMPLLYPAI